MTIGQTFFESHAAQKTVGLPATIQRLLLDPVMLLTTDVAKLHCLPTLTVTQTLSGGTAP
jgi:hypothetical protein